jgi:hypothetical protein
VAVAEVFVGEAALLGAEQKGDPAPGEALADEGRGLFEAFDRVLQLALADGGGANDEAAVRDGFSHTLELLGAGEEGRGSDGGTCFAEGQVVGGYDAKVEEAEVAHGAGGGADIERVARGDEDDTQAVEFGLGRQAREEFTAGEK